MIAKFSDIVCKGLRQAHAAVASRRGYVPSLQYWYGVGGGKDLETRRRCPIDAGVTCQRHTPLLIEKRARSTKRA